MKTKIILGLATLFTLALPAVAENRDGFRDGRFEEHARVSQGYRRAERKAHFRHERREMRERRIRMERERRREAYRQRYGFYR